MNVYPLLPEVEEEEISRQPNPIYLHNAVTAGSYHVKKYVMSQKYVELTKDMCNFLNEDWSIFKSMRYTCTRCLAGSIIIDVYSGRALLANCIEVYGRRRTLDDVHRESFQSKLGGSSFSSIPPVNTKYQNVYPTTISDSDGTKLIIGTKTFNALITSSIRLGIEAGPEVGPNTVAIDLSKSSAGKNDMIYIKESAWIEASEIAKNNNTTYITSFDYIYQLRQLRTRFHQLSTYFMCRSSNEIVDNLTTRPYTIYTLADLG